MTARQFRSVFPEVFTGSATLVPGSIISASADTAAFAASTIAVTGARLGDFALVSFDLDVRDLHTDAVVTASDVVTVSFGNLTGSTVTLGSVVTSVVVLSENSG